MPTNNVASDINCDFSNVINKEAKILKTDMTNDSQYFIKPKKITIPQQIKFKSKINSEAGINKSSIFFLFQMANNKKTNSFEKFNQNNENEKVKSKTKENLNLSVHYINRNHKFGSIIKNGKNVNSNKLEFVASNRTEIQIKLINNRNKELANKIRNANIDRRLTAERDSNFREIFLNYLAKKERSKCDSKVQKFSNFKTPINQKKLLQYFSQKSRNSISSKKYPRNKILPIIYQTSNIVE